MAGLAPEEGFKALKDQAAEAVKDIFPINKGKHTLRLKDIAIKDNQESDDLRSQKQARLDGKSWTVPVEGQLELVDNESGKVVDKRKTRLMNLPKVTNRHSYIVDGHEYQIDNQWRLKPGVYSRTNQTGELESMFNLKGMHEFKVKFDPKSANYTLKKGDTNIPLYPLLKEMGVSDDKLENSWGKDILRANQQVKSGDALGRFYRAVKKRKPESEKEAREHLHEFMDSAKMDPEVAGLTLGKKTSKLDGDVITRASQKLLGISRGDEKPDNRENLMFKTFNSAEDFIGESLKGRTEEIVRRIGNNLSRKDKIGDIVSTDIFDKPLKHMFTKTSLSNSPDQTNPLEMVSGSMKTTIMGDLGGITSDHKVTQEAKLVDSSHLGFLDPIHTPEGNRTGVTLHLPLGAQKKGDKVMVKMFNTKTGKMENVDPKKAFHSNIALPDQVKWDKGKPVAVGSKVKFSGAENEIEEGSMKDVDYVMAAPAQVFSPASNLIPFMQNTSGNRSTMAGRHMEQAIPLKHREAPLVQPAIAANKKHTSINSLLGNAASHKSPVGGEVVQVKNDGIVIKGDDGKKREVQIYDDFPVNDDKGFLNSTPLVKKGDKIKSGQVVADSNFTRNGDLALGTNLKAAYVPFKGYNFEDGVVISESASKKLTSEHMHRKGIDLTKRHVQDKNKFVAYHGTEMTKDQVEKLDDNGVVKKGQQVKLGDTLVAALRERDPDDPEAKVMARMHKSLVGPYQDASIKWEADHAGVVTNVVKRGKRTEVHVKTEEAAEIGDKLAGRHGNKGIITCIVPDHEMPKTKDGKSIEIALNPAGVPGRLNLGQVFETAAGKIAEKKGKPYVMQNFDGTADWTDRLQKEMKENGLEDKEELTDGTTGKSIGKALVGPHYIHKLKHQVSKKTVSRAGGEAGYAYDLNRIPKSGGPHGAQALDSLGMYAMLAHGAKSNIRDMQTYKSNAEGNDDMWAALQAGEKLPPPRPTFAYKKFTSYLKTIGVNVNKQGNSLNLVPLTDKDVLDMSGGELKDAGRMIVAKTEKEEKHGLFDKNITGGLEGQKWSHIKLPEKMPNPVFEKAVRSLTGLKKNELDSLMNGKSALDTKTGKLVSPEDGVSAGKAVEHLLKGIDVDKQLVEAEKKLGSENLKGGALNKVNLKVKYLKNLQKLGMSPTEAYMTQNIPVMPPSMRPLSIRPDGQLITDDLNHMYKGLALNAKKLKDTSALHTPEERNTRRAAVYDAMKSLTGVGGHLNREHRGVMDIIRGQRVKDGKKSGSPRDGFFQSKLVKRRQDMSMRSTIIPEPDLGLDEVGLPRKAAMEIYKPFVVKELRELGGLTPLKAKKAITESDPLAQRALERVAEQRPVLLKRDPVLHKYGVQAFKPVLTRGKAIKIHPLVTSGFNADFDGDTMAAFVPLTTDSVKEAHKMYPSRNLFAPATGSLMYQPTHESQLGVYMLGQKGKATNKAFKTAAEAAKAAHSGQIGMTDMVRIGSRRTTMGRQLIANALPKEMQDDVLSGKLSLDKSGQTEMLTRLAKDHKNDYGEAVNKIKDLGNTQASTSVTSIGLEDIKVDKKLRDRVMRVADKKVADIMAAPGKKIDKQKKAIQAYDQASESMIRGAEATHGKNPSALYHMMKAGVKPSMEAYRQIKMSPMLMMNAKGEVIPSPIRKSYSEGLDIGDYWTSMSGARKGAIQKVQSVREPGYLTKQVMNSVMNNSIGTEDCGTGKGIALPIEEKDVLDRYLATDTKAGKRILKSGTLITPKIRDSLRNNKVGRVVVRSPMRCEHGTGICSKCYGLDENGENPEIGKNVGIISGQAIGERATQLAMRTFHSGGVAPVGKKARQTSVITDQFERVNNLVQMYDKVPGSATLASAGGKITKVRKDPAGGTNVFVGEQRHYVPRSRGEPFTMVGGKQRKLRAGMTVQKGDVMSSGPVNPHELLPLTGINKVQGYVAGELSNLYKGEGIRRRNIETVVKSMTNLTKVEDPGDNKDYIRGDFAPTSYVQSLNKKLGQKSGKPIQHRPVLKGVKMLPLDMQTDWIARLNHERQQDTIIDAANQGWSSNIHGTHPIPGIVYGAEFGKGKLY